MEEIPILDAAGISTGNVKEVTAVEVEMKADSKVKQFEFLMLRITSDSIDNPFEQSTQASRQHQRQGQNVFSEKNFVL